MTPSKAGAPVMPLLTIQHEKDKVVPIPTNSPAPGVCPTKGVYPSQMKPRVNLLKWGWQNLVILCGVNRYYDANLDVDLSTQSCLNWNLSAFS